MGSKKDMFTMEGVTLQGVPLVYGVLQTKIAKIVTILWWEWRGTVIVINNCCRGEMKASRQSVFMRHDISSITGPCLLYQAFVLLYSALSINIVTSLKVVHFEESPSGTDISSLILTTLKPRQRPALKWYSLRSINNFHPWIRPAGIWMRQASRWAWDNCFRTKTNFVNPIHC